MPRNFVERVGNAIERRAFLRRMVAAAAALAAGVLGIPRANASITVLCCRLCKDPFSCTYANCGCEWAWCCCHHGNKLYNCYECWNIGTPQQYCQDKVCEENFIKCSKVGFIGVVDNCPC